MKIKRVLAFLWVLFFVSFVNAQIQDTEVLFYVKTDQSTSNPNTRVYVMKWKNGNRYVPTGTAADFWCDDIFKIVKNLKKDNNFYEKLDWKEGVEKYSLYNKEMSNNKWCVYANHFNAYYFYGQLVWPDHTKYYAVKRDLSEYMQWCEPDYIEDSEGRQTYRRLTKTELINMNFTATRDFLQ